MDNPQHYQPLSYALHPPNPSTTPKSGAPLPTHQREEIEDDEEGDESLVVDSLTQNDHPSDSSTAKTAGKEHQFSQETDLGGKRRPGRPRGSKNRKPVSSGPSVMKLDSTTHPTGTGTAPPQFPDVSSQNQQVKPSYIDAS